MGGGLGHWPTAVTRQTYKSILNKSHHWNIWLQSVQTLMVVLPTFLNLAQYSNNNQGPSNSVVIYHLTPFYPKRQSKFQYFFFPLRNRDDVTYRTQGIPTGRLWENPGPFQSGDKILHHRAPKATISMVDLGCKWRKGVEVDIWFSYLAFLSPLILWQIVMDAGQARSEQAVTYC